PRPSPSRSSGPWPPPAWTASRSTTPTSRPPTGPTGGAPGARSAWGRPAPPRPGPLAGPGGRAGPGDDRRLRLPRRPLRLPPGQRAHPRRDRRAPPGPRLAPGAGVPLCLPAGPWYGSGTEVEVGPFDPALHIRSRDHYEAVRREAQLLSLDPGAPSARLEGAIDRLPRPFPPPPRAA